MKKKVGLLIDSTQVSKQTFDLIKISMSAQNYSITTLVINDVSKHSSNIILEAISYLAKLGVSRFISKIFFNIICKLEMLLVRRISTFTNIYDKFELDSDNFDVIHTKPIISKSGVVYRYTDYDIKKIEEAGLDLLVRAGSGILRGEILTICPNGIISFHHADNDVNRGGPPGFWEVYLKNPRTGFIIQRLKNELDGGDVLYKGYITTSWLYSLNLANLYEISNPFLHHVIEDITSIKSTLNVQEKSPYSWQLYRNPNTTQIIVYLINTVKIFCSKLLRKIANKSYRWSVAYQFTENWRDVTLWRSKKIPNPKNRFLADPFLVKRNGVHYCFVEDYDYATKKGCISVYEITRKKCKELGVALTEDFHLSYPFIFQYKDELFMCPETHEKREIRIYKCEDFPLKWKFYKTIMKDVSAVDSSIFFHANKWWLFSNIDKSPVGDHGSQLHIFFSSDPLSDDWIPHDKNPVIFNSFNGRNGGLIQENNKTFRVYQRQGFDMYGEASGVAKINTLTPDSYLENSLFEIEPEFFPNIEGTHTYSFSEGLLAFDYVEVSKNKTGAESNTDKKI